MVNMHIVDEVCSDPVVRAAVYLQLIEEFGVTRTVEEIQVEDSKVYDRYFQLLDEQCSRRGAYTG
jgi:hypothetical protein